MSQQLSVEPCSQKRGWILGFLTGSRRIALVACLIALTGVGSLLVVRLNQRHAATSQLPGVDSGQTARLKDLYGTLPLSFEKNQGQTDVAVRFLARGPGYSLFLTPNEAVLSLSTASRATAIGEDETISGKTTREAVSNKGRAVLRLKLLGASSEASIAGANELPGKANYFIGKESKRWNTGISTFERVNYQHIYPGIDLTYYGNQRQLEYDFIVQPGRDPKQIAMGIEGADEVRIDDEGELIIKVGDREVRQHKPFAYQEINGTKHEIASGYELTAAHQIGFWLGDYDTTKPLVIDPVLVYSTYFGGAGNETASAITVNSAGEAFITGTTSSVNFPGSALQSSTTSGGDAYVVKLNAAGNAVLFASYFGGDNVDSANALTLDQSGNIYVAGSTQSFNFPTAGSPFQATKRGGAQMLKSTDGGATYASPSLGGLTTANISGVAVHPTDPNTAIVSSFGGEGIYKTSDGGASWTSIRGTIPDTFNNAVAIDPTDPSRMYLAACGPGGIYRSADGGATWSATSVLGLCMNTVIVDPSGVVYAGGYDGQGLHKSTDGGVTWTSYSVGGSFSVPSLAFDPTNSNVLYAEADAGVYKSLDAGQTWAVTGLSTGAAFDDALAVDPNSPQIVYANSDLQLKKTTDGGATWTTISLGLAANGHPTFITIVPTNPSTILVGSTTDGVLKSTDDGATWTQTGSTDDVSSSAFAPSDISTLYVGALSGADAFVTKLDASGSSLIYSTYLGGGTASDRGDKDDGANAIAVDLSGNAYITGAADTIDFPTQNPIQAFGGQVDTYLAKLDQNGSNLLFSTTLGGPQIDNGVGIALSPSGSVYLTGSTLGGFPTLNSVQGTFGGGARDAFVTRLNPSGNAFVVGYSTYLGGSANDSAFSIALDVSGNAHVVGQTNSGNYPVVNALQPARGGTTDAFLTKLDPSGTTRVYSTFLGGSAQDVARSIAVDADGNAYIAGFTNSSNFPVLDSLQSFGGGTCSGAPCNDAFITKINPSGSAKIYSTLLGGNSSDQAFGIALDSGNAAYVAGVTSSSEIKPGAIQPANGGGNDAFIAKVTPSSDLSITMTDSPDPVSINTTLTYTITATNSGGSNLTGVAVTDTLPADVTFVSATSSQGSCTGTTSANCNLGTLNVGQNASITIQVTPTKEGALTNSASATCNESETNSANNSATQDTRVTVGTVYTVNSNADTDDGACTALDTGNGCTLREALNAANNNAGKDTILFSIGSGLQTIAPVSSLPNLNTPIFLDATSQPGFAGQPIIELNGAGAGNAEGLHIGGGVNGCTVKGFVINRFGSHGLGLHGSNNVIQGNYIGTNSSGTAAAAVAFSSIFVGGNNNQIGGTTPAARNVLSGNGHQGIAMTGSGNVVQGNYIGTNASGTGAIGGGSVFIFQGASNNLIGGTAGTTPGGPCTGACNVISGNNGSVSINVFSGTGATNNTIQGNFIGLNAAGTGAIPNSGIGVYLAGVSGNHIVGNVISGNAGGGLTLAESDPTTLVGSHNNDVRGNFIGTNPAGTMAFPNGGGGIDLHGGSSGNTIGGANAADRNIISGNSNSGISISTFNGNAANNLVYGNYIGTDITGTVRLANTGNGISLMGVTANRIGGTQAGQGNLISGNNNQGVRIDMGTPGPNLAAVPADGNFVQGNLIGTNLAGTASLKNNTGGVSINGSHNNFIGGVVSGARNVISGNGSNGVTITNSAIIGSSSNNNKVQGNYIGTDATGTARLQNDSHGIGIYGGSTGNIIGGDDAADGATDGVVVARNIISGNNGDGVNMGNFAGAATANVVAGNYIGTNKLGTAAVANTGQGMGIYGTVNITIGGTTAGAGNLISGNNSGIVLGTASPGSGQPQIGATGTQILGNFIGTNATGTAVIRNTFSGVSMWGSGTSNNRVGGTAAGARNIISGNGGNGVDLGSFNGGVSGNFVEGNYVGTDVTGLSALVTTVSGAPFYGNGSGVGINGASNNKVGGTTAAERNVISGNNCQGVPIYNALQNGVVVQASNNTIQGNYIGLNKDGTALVSDPNGGAAFGNKCSGVFLGGSINNLIGGTAPGAGNVIGGSAHQGIVVGNNNGVIGSGNTIQGNIIGSNVTMTAALPNGIGVFLFNGSSNNIVGGDDDDDGSLDGVVRAGNKIFASTGDGINLGSIPGFRPTGNIIQGNLIGGSTLLRNTNNGVNINGGLNNVVGGTSAGAGNTISFNGNNGIVVNCPTLNGVVTCGVGNVFTQNSIHTNSNIGIRMNTVGGQFGNNNQAPPVVSFVSTNGANTTAAGTLTSVANSQFTLDFYSNDACDPTGAGEGQTYIGSTQVTTDGSGAGSFNVSSLAAVPVGKIITATATHGANGTSRFSSCLVASSDTATISGRATDQIGSPIAGATITLSGGQNASATTDAQGSYSFPNLPSNVSYTVAVTLSGVTFYPSSFTLANLPADRTVNFTKVVVRYTITDLGALTPGPQSVGWDVNNAGQATGWSAASTTATNFRPYFYNSGTITNLTPLGSGTNALAIAMNDNGRIVGYSELAPQAAGGAFSGQIHGFFSDSGGALKDIGTFGGASSQAWGVNDNGVVVGQAQNANNQSRPFVWRDLNSDGLWQLSEMIDAGWINNGPNGRLFAINNNNVAVGNGIDGLTGFQTATLWKDDNANGVSDPGELRLLGTLGGPTSFAQSINDNGYVSGVTDISGLASNGRTMQRAFIWHDDNGNGVSDPGEMKNLGTLGGEFSAGLRINAANEIVGWSDAVGILTAHAIRWKNNFMLDLNAAIPQDSGWVLQEARGFSDDGKITGYGTINGASHAYLLTPSSALQSQTVTFDPISNKTYGTAPFTVNATASSNLPVTFSVVSGPATVNGNTVTVTGAGSVTLRATQAGDGTYESASADQTFTVATALLRVIADSKTKVFGAPNPTFTAHYSGFVNGEDASVLGGTLSFTTAADNSPVGAYSITPSGYISSNYTIQYLSATLTIDQASTSTTSANYNLPVPGNVNLVAQVTADLPSSLQVAGGTVTFVIRQGGTTVGSVTTGAVNNGSAGAVFNIPGGGAYTVYASYSGNTNYFGSTGLASLTVGNANPIPGITGVTPDSAVKKPTETGQFTLLIDGNGFISTTNGDPANSTVDWHDRTTGQHTNMAITSITGSQIQAVVPYTLIRDGKTVEITVINPGPGGGASNVQPFFVTDTTATVTSAETVIPDPVTGNASTTSVTPSGAVLSAEAASGGAGGSGTLTVAQYSADPIGTNSSPNTSAFSTAEGGGYFDVYVSPGSSFTSLTLDYCNTGGTTLYWWNGSIWGLVSNQTYNPATGCITVMVTTTSSPSIAQLTGTVFGVGGGPAISSMAVTPSATISVGSGPITLNATISDATGTGPYMAEINWGDGQTTLNNVAGPTLTATHNYAAANTYAIIVKVSRGSSFGTSTFSPLVVIDPNGGSMNVAGWFNAPLGAYPSSPSFAGKVHFESEARYEGSALTGSAKVKLPNGEFQTASLSWLIIGGSKLQVSGVGNINNTGSYGFLLTGIDGKVDGKKLPDKVRIKIWSMATGATIFDSQMDAPDAAAPAIVLGGGNVNIKK